MRTTRPLALALAIALAMTGAASAQCWVGAGVVNLTINGVTPSVADPIGHVVPVIGDNWTVGINGPSANIGTPFALLIDALDTITCGATVVGGISGSVDFANPVLVLNGLAPTAIIDFFGFTNFNLTLSLGIPCTAAQGPAVQAVVLDFTQSPFPYAFTQVGRASKLTTSTLTLTSVITDDSFVTYNMSACNGVKFAGITYTRLFIGSNGCINFTAGSTDFSPSTGEFFNGMRTVGTAGSNPGVACMWADYFPSAATTDGIAITEDTSTPSLKVEYQNQVRWDSNTAAGTFSVLFDGSADTVLFDLSTYTPLAVANTIDEPTMLGVTKGSTAPGTNTSLDISANNGYTTGTAPESIVETFAFGAGALDLKPANGNSHILFSHLGGYAWNMVLF